MASKRTQIDLVAERKRKNLGTVEAAKKIGISFGSLKLVEAGVEPRSDVARKVAEFYGFTTLDLWPPEQHAA